jgi:hypothetical protein
MTLSDHQLERVTDVRRWYEDIHRLLDGHAPESVRYMTLWAVFNALYNIADYPKVELRSVSVDDGKTKPYIRGRDDDKKLRFISRSISKDTELVCLVQDNLNTHDISAFYENLPADEALALAERFDFYFTPKSASWLHDLLWKV